MHHIRGTGRACHPAGLILTLVLLMVAAPTQAARAANAGGPNSQHDEVLDALATLQQDIDAIRTDLTSLSTEVNNVKREVIDCTRTAWLAGECPRVRETTASACFELKLFEPTLGLEWEAKTEGKGEGGAGWTSGPDGKIVINLSAPVGPVPTGWKAGFESGAAIKGDFCVEVPIEILGEPQQPAPVTTSTFTAAATPSRLEALEIRLEDVANSIMPVILERMETDMPSGDRLQLGFDAARRISDGEFNLDQGLFGDPLLQDLTAALPTPQMLRTVLEDPGALAGYLPQPSGNLRERVQALCDPNTGLAVTRLALFQNQSAGICAFLEDAPQFDEIAELIPDLPEAVKGLIAPLVDKAGEVAENTTNRFCSSRVGSVFSGTRLCG
jgi:hypothetical protein